MSERQLPLFPSQPVRPEDISRLTPLAATMQLFKEHLLQEGKTEHTVKAFLGDMNLLAEHTGSTKPVGEYTTEVLNSYLHWMEYGRGVPCSRKTYARRVTTLKVYFKWLKQLNAIPIDPAKAILQRSGPAPLSHVLSDEQISDAFSAAQNMKRGEHTDYRPEWLFRLLLETGIKKSEAGRLRIKDIDVSNASQPLVFIRHKARNVYKERRIPLSAEAITLFSQYLQQYQPPEEVFTCTTRNLEYILTDIGEAAGIPFKLSFEVMRWTSAVRDYQAGIEEDTIREKLGLSRTSWYETSSKIRQLAEMLQKQQNTAS